MQLMQSVMCLELFLQDLSFDLFVCQSHNIFIFIFGMKLEGCELKKVTKVNLHKKYTAQNWSNCVSVLMHTIKCTIKNVEQSTPSTKIWIVARQICTLRCICTPEFSVCTPITPSIWGVHAEDLLQKCHPFQTGSASLSCPKAFRWSFSIFRNGQVQSPICFHPTSSFEIVNPI